MDTEPHPIDRIDSRGDIREHLTRDGAQTICGLSLLKTQTQPPCGNRKCRNCARVRARKG